MQKFFREEKYIFLFYSLFMICFVFWIPEKVYDDAVFSQISGSLNWFYERYFVWSSRLVIEYVLIFLCKHDILIFKSITLLILLITPIILSKLIDKQNTYYCYGICFLYGLESMGTAGWIATFTNYYYVFFCLLISIFALRSQRMSSLLLAISIVYATNHEQGLLIFLCTIIVQIYYNHRNHQIYVAACITFIMLLIVLLSPGNEARYYSEIKTWNPSFIHQTFFYKSYLGITTTLYRYTIVPNITMLFLLFCIFINKYKNIKKSLYITMAILAISFLNYISIDTQNIEITKTILVYANDLTSLTFRHMLYLIYSLILFGYIIYQCYSLLHTDERNLAIFILMIGLSSRFVIGLSPTLFVSSTRTYIFCDFSILSVSYIFFSHIKKEYKNKIIWCAIIAQLIHYGSFLF